MTTKPLTDAELDEIEKDAICPELSPYIFRLLADLRAARGALEAAPKIPVHWIGSAEYWTVYVDWFEGTRKAALPERGE